MAMFLLLLLCILRVENANSNQMQIPVPVGAVVDVNSSFGAMVSLCMDMAISDFYSLHSNYSTRLQLIKKDVKESLHLNMAVKHEQVVAILGSRGSMQEVFAAPVPILSFVARSSASSYDQNGFILRTTLDDSVQAEALASICLRFGWSEAVIFYEDTESGKRFLSNTIKKLQDADIRLSYMAALLPLAEDSQIKNQLELMKGKQTRVFLVHMSPELGSRLFALANDAGMMSQGYAWIITDSLSIFLSSIVSGDTSMDGVLGIRPYVFASKTSKSFSRRYKRSMLMSKSRVPAMDLNIYGLWAYDTVTALALAVEMAKPLDSSFGSRLVSEVSRTKFAGLAGDFELVDGKLKASEYEIFNMIGNGERRIGFWSLERGISRNELRKIVWPGYSVTQPKGWSIPPTGNLRVGVPWRSGFVEFINVAIDPETNQTRASGFAVDVFLEVLKQLPFPLNHTFHCINDTSGGSLGSDIIVRKIKLPCGGNQEVDIVVAGTAIWAPRAEYIDFSLPYSESGIVLVVKNEKPFDMWIFIRPLRWDLWLAIVVASVFMGIALCILENRGSDHKGLIYLSPVALLAFQDRSMVLNKWSVFVLVCWMFMAFVLMQSFTANLSAILLSAILTLDQLKFSFSQDYCVGYQEGSFVKVFLNETLNINTCLKGYSSIQVFHEGMSKGSKNGGVDAIFDELPYMKLLLNRYKSRYKIVGPTYGIDGFGFAFPPGSPLVRHFSKAILKVTQGETMLYIQRKNFGPGYSSQDPLSSVISQGTSGLALHEFVGLFLVTGSCVLFALFCSITSISTKLSDAARLIIRNSLSFRSTELSSFAGDGGSDDRSTTHLEQGRAIGDEGAEISEKDSTAAAAAQSRGER